MKNLTCVLISLSVLLSLNYPAFAGLSETEERITQIIDQRDPAAREFLRQVVGINSGSMNFPGVRQVGDLFDKSFTDLGLKTRWVDGATFNRAGHLIAEHQAAKLGSPHLLMIGHLDTVFESDSGFQQFVSLDNDQAGGPGITDMKGGNVIIVEAIAALAELNLLDHMSITVVLIGDEESSGRPLSIGRAALLKAAEAADIALAFENGDGDPATAVIARRGYSGWKLEVEGKPAHSSVVFKKDVGAGSIYETARILNAFYNNLVGEQYLTFNPGVILGGTTVNYDAGNTRGDAFGKPNVIAETTVVTGDLRTITIKQREKAKSRMRKIVSASLPHTQARITFTDGYPPLAPTQGNKDLLNQYSQVSIDLGQGEVTANDPGSAGAADVSFTAGLVDMAIDGLGMSGSGAHTVREVADMGSLARQTKRAAILMLRLSSSD